MVPFTGLFHCLVALPPLWICPSAPPGTGRRRPRLTPRQPRPSPHVAASPEVRDPSRNGGCGRVFPGRWACIAWFDFLNSFQISHIIVDSYFAQTYHSPLGLSHHDEVLTCVPSAFSAESSR